MAPSTKDHGQITWLMDQAATLRMMAAPSKGNGRTEGMVILGWRFFFLDLGGVENLKILASLYFDMPFGSEIMETSFFLWCRIPWFMEWAVMSEALRVWQFHKLLQRFLSSIFHILTQWRMMRLYPRYESWYSFWYSFSEEWPGGRWRSSQKNSTTWWELHGVINSVNSHTRWKRMIHSYILWRTHLDS